MKNTVEFKVLFLERGFDILLLHAGYILDLVVSFDVRLTERGHVYEEITFNNTSQCHSSLIGC